MDVSSMAGAGGHVSVRVGRHKSQPRAFRPFELSPGREGRLEQRFCVSRQSRHFYHPLSEACETQRELVD